MFRVLARGRSKHGRIRLALLVAIASPTTAAPARADVDTTPPVATITASSALTSLQRVSFNEGVTGITGNNIVLRVASETANLRTSFRCKNGSGAAVGCGTSGVQVVEFYPGTPLTAGQSYAIIVNPEGALPVVDQAANPAATTARGFRASVLEEETSAGATYVWRTAADSAAIGGSYRTERQAGAAATYRFTGTTISWYTRLGPAEGRATVAIDGIVRAIVSNYRSSVLFPASRRFIGLSSGSHVITITVRGEKGAPAGTGTWIAVDALRVGSEPFGDAVMRWPAATASGASGGHFVRSSTPGSRVAFRFKGGGVDWFTVTGPYEGKAMIYIDNKLSRTYDNYSPTTRYFVRRTVTGLTDALHAITIVVAGTKNPASRSSYVSVDRWVLRAGTLVFRKLGTWVDLWDYNGSTSEATIEARIADMDARGVRTLYLQTGRWNTAAFAYPTQAGIWIDKAHAAGIAVVGWYLPAYSEYLSQDILKTAAIASFAGPSGGRFDGLAIDIEYRVKNDSKSEFFSGISSHLAGVRSRVGLVFPVGAITFSPLDMDRWTAGWDGFPWSSVAKYADAVMPMGYWSVSSNRTRCSGGQPQYCPYQFTLQNVLRTRSATGLPVHEIGGVGNAITAAEVSQYVQAERDAHAWGGGIYDYGVTEPAFWAPLAGINTL